MNGIQLFAFIYLHFKYNLSYMNKYVNYWIIYTFYLYSIILFYLSSIHWRIVTSHVISGKQLTDHKFNDVFHDGFTTHRWKRAECNKKNCKLFLGIIHCSTFKLFSPGNLRRRLQPRWKHRKWSQELLWQHCSLSLECIFVHFSVLRGEGWDKTILRIVYGKLSEYIIRSKLNSLKDSKMCALLELSQFQTC